MVTKLIVAAALAAIAMPTLADETDHVGTSGPDMAGYCESFGLQAYEPYMTRCDHYSVASLFKAFDTMKHYPEDNRNPIAYAMVENFLPMICLRLPVDDGYKPRCRNVDAELKRQQDMDAQVTQKKEAAAAKVEAKEQARLTADANKTHQETYYKQKEQQYADIAESQYTDQMKSAFEVIDKPIRDAEAKARQDMVDNIGKGGTNLLKALIGGADRDNEVAEQKILAMREAREKDYLADKQRFDAFVVQYDADHKAAFTAEYVAAAAARRKAWEANPDAWEAKETAATAAAKAWIQANPSTSKTLNPVKTLRMPSCGEDYYPPQAKRLNMQGSVIVEICVGINNTVESTKVRTSSGFPELDHAAQECAAAGTYKAGMTPDGKPAPSCKDIRITFAPMTGG